MDSNSATLPMRARVLQQATRLFVTSGYDSVSMREIAEACGITKAGLYYHFLDKETLFLAILSDNLDELSLVLRESAVQPGGTRAQLAYFAKGVFTRLPIEQRGMIRMAGQEMNKLSPSAQDTFGQRYQVEFIGRLGAILEQGMQRGELRPADPILTTWILMGMMYPFLSAGSESRPERGDAVVEFLLDVFFNGMKANSSSDQQ